jgi:hypothetical protein
MSAWSKAAFALDSSGYLGSQRSVMNAELRMSKRFEIVPSTSGICEITRDLCRQLANKVRLVPMVNIQTQGQD